MSKIGNITLTGESGTNYSFEIYARSTEFNAVGGIYVMAKKTAANTYSVLYVGQTGDLSSRPLNHHKKDCFDKNGADHVFVHAEGNEKTRFNIETDLINAYKPKCNG